MQELGLAVSADDATRKACLAFLERTTNRLVLLSRASFATSAAHRSTCGFLMLRAIVASPDGMVESVNLGVAP
jgi:hypothetical protein